MARRTIKSASATAASLFIMALVIGTGAPAATAASAPPVPSTVTVQLTSTGVVDNAIAAANGFAVKLDAQGNEFSVPVTAEAKALVASSKLNQPKTVAGGSTNAIVYGNCGSSDLVASRIGVASVKTVTGFQVRLPTAFRVWIVKITRFGNLSYTQDYSGGPTGIAWHDSQAKNIGDNRQYGASVTLDSFAVLIDGTECRSGGPRV